MQILGNTSNNYQPTSAFTSRKAEINALDKLCRRVSLEFPVHSSTRMNSFTSVNKHPHAFDIFGFLDDIISDMRGFMRTIPDKKKELRSELKNIKELKTGNCNELATAGFVACKMNGYKNSTTMHVYAFNPQTQSFRTLDHVMVGVNFTRELKNKPKCITSKVFCDDRKAMVVDPWCGFADYANNASVKYRSHMNFGKNLDPEEKICYIPVNETELNRKDILFFRHTYPNLSEKKKFGIIDRIIWAFTKKDQFDAEAFPRTIFECHRTNHHLKGALTPDGIKEMYVAEQQNKLQEFFEEVRKK